MRRKANTRRGPLTNEEQMLLLESAVDLQGSEEAWEHVRRVAGMIPGKHSLRPAPKRRQPLKRKSNEDAEHLFDGEAWIEKRNQIVVENLPWARGIAERIARRLPSWFTVEDLMGHAGIALIRVADQYASYQRVPFRAFAVQRLRGACFDAIRRREYKERGHQSLDAQIDGEPAIHEAVDRSPNPERLAELAEMTGVWAHTWKLPGKHGQVIRLIYGEEVTGAEAGRRMKLSEPRISQLHREALGMLREVVKR